MISGGLCASFKVELLQGIHNFAEDDFYIALYDDSAALSPLITSYLTEGEIAGPGYIAGGQLLTGAQVLGPVALMAYATFDDPIWPNASLVARGALIYNASQNQRAVCVLDFLADRSSNQGEFRVKLPSPSPSTALIRLL